MSILTQNYFVSGTLPKGARIVRFWCYGAQYRDSKTMNNIWDEYKSKVQSIKENNRRAALQEISDEYAAYYVDNDNTTLRDINLDKQHICKNVKIGNSNEKGTIVFIPTEDRYTYCFLSDIENPHIETETIYPSSPMICVNEPKNSSINSIIEWLFTPIGHSRITNSPGVSGFSYSKEGYFFWTGGATPQLQHKIPTKLTAIIVGILLLITISSFFLIKKNKT